MKIKTLIGSGDRIMLPTLPFLAIGLALNFWRPALFEVGGPSAALRAIALAMLAVGVVVWLWSVVLILAKVPKHQLITSGPFAIVKHPLYTAVALLVIPSVGLLLNSWLGIAVGLVMYLMSRRYAPQEERALAEAFGSEWIQYAKKVKLPWA